MWVINGGNQRWQVETVGFITGDQSWWSLSYHNWCGLDFRIVFYTDNKSKTLREKILAKFTPRIAPSSNTKNIKSTPKLVPASIDKVPPLPLLPAKTAKEINTILKYFQNQKPLNNKSKDRLKSNKSYTQASKNTVSTTEVLKIKKTFPTLNAEKSTRSIISSMDHPSQSQESKWPPKGCQGNRS